MTYNGRPCDMASEACFKVPPLPEVSTMKCEDDSPLIILLRRRNETFPGFWSRACSVTTAPCLVIERASS